jgi:hypothetical protein
MHLSNGTNIVQLSRVLGHHSPAFTLSRYTHLLPGEAVPALECLEAAECDQSAQPSAHQRNPS